MEVNIHEAKTHLSRLLQKVSEGEEVIISRAGVPVARLVAVSREQPTRPLGIGKGEIWLAADFSGAIGSAIDEGTKFEAAIGQTQPRSEGIRPSSAPWRSIRSFAGSASAGGKPHVANGRP